MIPTQQLLARLQTSLHAANAQGKLCVLAAVSGINEKRVREIMNGAEPTVIEFSTLDALRSM